MIAARIPAPTPAPGPASGHEEAEALADALLTASRLLVTVTVRSLHTVAEALTLPQFRMLTALYERGPLNLSTLAGELDVQPSTAMRMSGRLSAAGMVARDTLPDDRRACVISLTGEGRRTVAEVTERRRGAVAGIAARIPPWQRCALIEGLRTFTGAGGGPCGRGAGP